MSHLGILYVTMNNNFLFHFKMLYVSFESEGSDSVVFKHCPDLILPSGHQPEQSLMALQSFEGLLGCYLPCHINQ